MGAAPAEPNKEVDVVTHFKALISFVSVTFLIACSSGGTEPGDAGPGAPEKVDCAVVAGLLGHPATTDHHSYTYTLPTTYESEFVLSPPAGSLLPIGTNTINVQVLASKISAATECTIEFTVEPGDTAVRPARIYLAPPNKDKKAPVIIMEGPVDPGTDKRFPIHIRVGSVDVEPTSITDIPADESKTDDASEGTGDAIRIEIDDSVLADVGEGGAVIVVGTTDGEGRTHEEGFFYHEGTGGGDWVVVPTPNPDDGYFIPATGCTCEVEVTYEPGPTTGPIPEGGTPPTSKTINEKYLEGELFEEGAKVVSFRTVKHVDLNIKKTNSDSGSVFEQLTFGKITCVTADDVPDENTEEPNSCKDCCPDPVFLVHIEAQAGQLRGTATTQDDSAQGEVYAEGQAKSAAAGTWKLSNAIYIGAESYSYTTGSSITAGVSGGVSSTGPSLGVSISGTVSQGTTYSGSTFTGYGWANGPPSVFKHFLHHTTDTCNLEYSLRAAFNTNVAVIKAEDTYGEHKAAVKTIRPTYGKITKVDFTCDGTVPGGGVGQ
jgi:hypothetical protein